MATEIRHTGAGFNSEATGELDADETVVLEDDAATRFVEEYQFEYVDEEADTAEPAAEAETEPGSEEETLTDLEGVGASTARDLRSAGYETFDDLRAADEGEIVDRTGIRPPLVSAIKDQLGAE